MSDSHAESTFTQPAPTEQPERLDLRSHEIVSDKQAEIARLFPEVSTEGGKIDFDRLKRALGETVDPGKERYGMSWPGKADCFKAIQRPTMGTLLPCREESVNFDTTENVIIEGDNLEVLKLMQKAYLGRVKLVYIDPPYNTGNDFVYPDDYTESLQTYLEYTGQVDSEGRKFSTNTEADGRFHSKWLNMMYPRLYLANNLLSDDGAIFVSIDDHEVSNLKNLMNEIFGEESFVAQIAVVNNLKGRNDRRHIATAHEYLLVYAKPLFESNGLPLSEKQKSEYRHSAESGIPFQWRDLRKRGGADTRAARPKLFFPIYADQETGDVSLEKNDRFSVEVFPKKSDGTDGCWRWGQQKVKANLADLKATKVENKDRWNVSYRVYLERDGEERTSKPKSIWMGAEFSTDSATKTFASLVPEVSGVTPKPVELIKQIARLAMDEEDICLDFFAGSGTTGQAIVSLNIEDGGNRRFVLVQLPEPVESATIPNLAAVCRERCKRYFEKALDTTNGENPLAAAQHDLGFRAFTLDESNFSIWNSGTDTSDIEAFARQLELHAHHVRTDRSADDILFELLIKSGFGLDTKFEIVTICGNAVYSVADGAMLMCLDHSLSLDLMKDMAERKPERVIVLDDAFAGSDQLKTNAVQIMKAKGVTSFRTV